MARVLTLSWEYPPIVEGGLARHVRKLSEALVAQGHEVHVLTRGGHRLADHETRGGVRVHRVPEPRKPTDLDAFVQWIAAMDGDMAALGTALLARHRFDVVHGHDWLVARAAAKLAGRAGVPYATTVHATEYGRHQGWVDKHPQSHIHGVEREMCQRADAVVTCSAYMREHVVDVFDVPEAKVSVIPNGIDPADLGIGEQELGELRARYAAPDEQLVLLTGRLVYEKGFQLALEALPGVIERVGKVRFVIAGSGTHEEELKQLSTELGLDDHGTFVGWLGDDVLHALYRVADLTVVPSLYEPFGLVALEAMASGCPTIVADTGGLREVVPTSDVGLRFRSRDPRSLARMMERVLSDRELAAGLVAEALEHVRRFDWDDVARSTASLHASLVADRRSAAAARRSVRAVRA